MIIGLKGLGLFGSVAATAAGPSYDPDAQTYIDAVEAADGQALETGVKDAINTFVIGCKSDGIWTAIKASCILAGARTLSGALVPLVGTAPTNNNFVSGDYSRTGGLTGDAATKYLDSNRNQEDDPQDSNHLIVFVSSLPTTTTLQMYIGGLTHDIYRNSSTMYFRNMGVQLASATIVSPVGFIGHSRSDSNTFTARFDGTDTIRTGTSSALSANVFVFGRSSGGGPLYTNASLGFYSIGESLDLAMLDSRVTTLISSIGAAIP